MLSSATAAVDADTSAASPTTEDMRAKLLAAEALADKLRKAAAHWKKQHDALKLRLSANDANDANNAPAAAPATAT